jgi:ADP-ribose pyrophosphatase YjhB (NUDIX family)
VAVVEPADRTLLLMVVQVAVVVALAVHLVQGIIILEQHNRDILAVPLVRMLMVLVVTEVAAQVGQGFLVFQEAAQAELVFIIQYQDLVLHTPEVEALVAITIKQAVQVASVEVVRVT